MLEKSTEIEKGRNPDRAPAAKVHDPTMPPSTPSVGAQQFVNGEVHEWYRLVLGYSDHLVSNLLDEFAIRPGMAVVDPFCGSGTTSVECMKRGVHSWAIDANPSSCFAAKVKTNWNLNAADITAATPTVIRSARALGRETNLLRKDATYNYIKKAGMIGRGWISRKALYEGIALKLSIKRHVPIGPTRDLMMLAAMNEFVHTASNVKFGPELYCSKSPSKRDILSAFASKLASMLSDIDIAKNYTLAECNIYNGDSRSCKSCIPKPPPRGFDAIISSPPYPTEHDYTRNARLELAYLEAVQDLDSLRAIKKTMVRSHTKGIYSTDSDSDHVVDLPVIADLVKIIDERASQKSHGFARLYSRVLREYIGGMRLHFRSILPLLRSGARAAYVVGDQASYLQVPIPTAKLLGIVAEKEGFKLLEIRKWRHRWVPSSKSYLDENILIMEAP